MARLLAAAGVLALIVGLTGCLGGSGDPAPPSISLSTTSLDFMALEGGGDPSLQGITVDNGGGQTLEVPTTDVVYGVGNSWLTVNVTGAAAPFTVTVQPATGPLAAGTYAATIDIFSTGAGNSPQSVAVSLTVYAAGTPFIGLDQTSMDFAAFTGGADPGTQQLTITNLWPGTLNWSASGDAPWLSVSPPSGANTGTPQVITVTVATGSLTAGTHSATITVTGSGAANSPQTVDVTFTVTDPIPAIGLSSSSLAFSASEGGPNPADQTVDLTNSGDPGSVLAWSAVSDSRWLAVSPGSGTTPAGPDALIVSVDVTERWTGPTSTAGAPSARQAHAAVWTGTEMLVWGGTTGAGGHRYSPATDTWTAMSVLNEPSARAGHTAVWTGTEMIVWGGHDGTNALNGGGAYNPSTDSWRAIFGAGAPTGRSEHSAVWTGSEMIVWGGMADIGVLGTGSRYNPVTGFWGNIATSGGPGATWGHTAVFTGTEMIVWGGWEFFGGWSTTRRGWRYDVATNTWVGATSTAGAPTGREAHSAVWDGTQMIVWGGSSWGPGMGSGGRYTPDTDTWVGGTATTGAPAGRGDHSAVWTGVEMIVWGGAVDYGTFPPTVTNTGGRYVPPMTAGTHAGTITVADAGASNSPQVIDVTLTVAP